MDGTATSSTAPAGTDRRSPAGEFVECDPACSYCRGPETD